MLYHLFDWLKEEGIRFPGSELFRFITFRVLAAVLLSLFITLVYGKKLIKFLQKKQISESIREEGLAGEESKRGTPTMGGIIIILAIIIPTLLLADLTNVYVQVLLISTVWLLNIVFINKIIVQRPFDYNAVIFTKTFISLTDSGQQQRKHTSANTQPDCDK